LCVTLHTPHTCAYTLAQTTGNTALFAPYDILALAPTTAATFSLACLTHAQPSPLTTHLIALPFGGPRLPFNLKHTLIRAALRAGAAFELPYAGALGEGPSSEGGGAGTRRNWWAGARELLRVTKGRGVVVSGGVGADVNLRAPRDIANLYVRCVGRMSGS
jgi:ribonuclease P/MRP protein subunit RPP1